MAYEIPDNELYSQINTGRSMRREQMGGAPRFGYDRTSMQPSKSDIVLQALLGLNAGSKSALESASLGDPLVSFLAGSAGAATAPNVQDIRRKQAIEQMDLDPFEKYAPGAAKEYGLEGTPMAIAQKLLPVMQRERSGKRALELAYLKEQWRDDNATISAREAEYIADAFKDPGLAERLTGLRRSAAVNILPKMAFDPSTGGVTWLSPKAFTAAPAGSGQVGSQVQSLLNGISSIRSLQGQYQGLADAGKTGIAAGNAEILKGIVSGGKFSPEATTYNNFRKGFKASLKSITGESGVLSDDDSRNILALIPPVGMDANAAAKQFREIYDLLDTRIENYKIAYPQFAHRIPAGMSASGEGRSGGLDQKVLSAAMSRAQAELKRRQGAAPK